MPIVYIINSANTSNKSKAKKEEKYFHLETEKNLVKLCQKLLQHDWGSITSPNDVNEAYDSFVNTYIAMYNQCCPLRKRKSKDRNKLWMTKGLINARKKKSMLYKEFMKKRNNETEAKYKNIKTN